MSFYQSHGTFHIVASVVPTDKKSAIGCVSAAHFAGMFLFFHRSTIHQDSLHFGDYIRSLESAETIPKRVYLRSLG